MDRRDIAGALIEMAELMELAGENSFRARAYLRAARALEEYPGPLTSAEDAKPLANLEGIGTTILARITTLLETGSLPELEKLRARVPSTLRELLRVPGLGSKKIQVIHETLGVSSIAELEAAARDNRLVDIPGFGPKTQESILGGLVRMRRYEGQWLLPDARTAGETIRAALATIPGIRRVAIAGEVRRWCEIVGAIDLVVAGDVSVLSTEIEALPGITDVLERGGDRLTVRVRSGITTNIHLVPDESFGTTLLALTGSPTHLDSLAARAAARGLRLDRNGLFRNGTRLPLAEEPEIYRALEMGWVPPECREGTDELERAMRGDLAALVVASDLRGVMHMHSTWSDGHASILEMARAAAARGYAFMGISDHSRSAGYAGGLDIDRVQAQRAEIARLNQGESPIPILSGIESDILADGALDYPDDVLAGFDFVIASVHSRFKMDRAEMTARMLRAIASPYVAILAHPSGRLLLDRDPYDVDMEAVIQACARERVAIEINSNPRRLDIDWRHVPHARSAGATFAVNPDAHTPEELDLVTYGIAMARKGGLTAREVLNTWDLGTARAFFRARRPRSG